MPDIRLRVDENDPAAVAEECQRVANLRPREFPPVRYAQKLLAVAAQHMQTGRRKAKRANEDLDLRGRADDFHPDVGWPQLRGDLLSPMAAQEAPARFRRGMVCPVLERPLSEFPAHVGGRSRVRARHADRDGAVASRIASADAFGARSGRSGYPGADEAMG